MSRVCPLLFALTSTSVRKQAVSGTLWYMNVSSCFAAAAFGAICSSVLRMMRSARSPVRAMQSDASAASKSSREMDEKARAETIERKGW